MRIISSLLPAEPSDLMEGRATIVMALDTLVGEKSVVVGITVGGMDGPDINSVRVSAVGQAIIDRGSRHMQRNYPQGSVVVAGVAQVAGAKQRVRQVLAGAPPQSFVLLLCADNKVCDAAFGALGIDLQALNQRSQ